MNKYLFFLLGIIILTGICAYSLEKNNYKNEKFFDKNKIVVAMGGGDEEEPPPTDLDDGKPEPKPNPAQEDEDARKRRLAEETAIMRERARYSETLIEIARKRRERESRPPTSIPAARIKSEVQPMPYQSQSWDYMKQKIPQKIITKCIIQDINDDYSLQVDDKKMLKLENIVFNNERKNEILEFIRSNFVGKKATIFHSVDRTGSYSYEMKRDKQGNYLIQNIKIQNEDLVNELVRNQFASIVSQ